jgi:hypothetical protein
MLHTSRAHEHHAEVTLRRTSRISVRRGDTIMPYILQELSAMRQNRPDRSLSVKCIVFHRSVYTARSGSYLG